MTVPEARDPRDHSLVVISGGNSDPSSTRLLADRIASSVVATARGRDTVVDVVVVELRALATEIATAMTTRIIGPGLEAAASTIAGADGLIVSTPVYNAGPSGLLTSFFQVLDDDLVIARPVILAATAGTGRHALVVDEQMRSLFAYLRALTVPTSVFAAADDWADTSLGARIERAAFELVLLMESGFADRVREVSWGAYRHEYGSAAAEGRELDFDSDMMRLAAGGSLVDEEGPAPGTG